MIDIQMPDGSTAKVPEFAMEVTQQSMLALMKAMVAGDDKSFKAYEKLIKLQTEQNKQVADEVKSQEERDKEAKQILEDIADATEQTADSTKKLGINGKVVLDGIFKFNDAVLGIAKIAGGAMITGFGLLAKSSYNLGNTLADLAQTGIGLNDSQSGSTIAAIANLNRLGFSSAQAAEVMAGYAGVVQGVGKNQFVKFNQEIGKLTNYGAKFGMSMNELAGVVAEDLETRRKLGALGEFEAASSAARSQALFQKQLEATSILGKTIDDIRGASRNTLEDNANTALRVQQIALKKGAEAAAEYQAALQLGLGSLASRGLGQSVIDAVGEQVNAAIPFSSASGKELQNALLLMGDGGDQMVDSIRKMNEASAAGDTAAMAKEMKNFEDIMGKTAKSMNADDLAMYQLQLQNLGPMGEAIALSLGEVKLAAGKAAGSIAELSVLASGAKAFDNAVGQVKGGVTAMLTDLTGALGPVFEQVAGSLNSTMAELPKGAKDVAMSLSESGDIMRTYTDAAGNKIVENVSGQMGIMDAFKIVMEDIQSTMGSLFGEVTEGETGFKNLSDTIRSRIAPALLKFGEWFKDGGGKKVLNALSFVGGIFSGMATVLGTVVSAAMSLADGFVWVSEKLGAGWDYIKGLFGVESDVASVKDTAESMAGLGKTLGMAIISIALFSKALKAASAVKSGAGMIKGLFGGGGAAATATSGAAGAAGKTAAGVGGGLGKGIGGFFKGIAAGLKTLGSAAAMKGAVTLLLVGGAIMVAGKGFQEFSKLDWTTIGKGLVGMAGLGAIAGVLGMFAPAALLGAAALAAIGLALNLFPVDVLAGLGTLFESAFAGIATVIDSVFGGIGDVIGKVSEAINSFKTAGAEADNMRLEGATNAVKELAGIDESRFSAISVGIDSIANSLMNFSEAVGSGGWFGGGADVEKQMEQVGVFQAFASLDATAITASATALGQIADVYGRFAALDADALSSSAEAISKLNKATGAEQSVAEKAISVFKSGIDLVSGAFSVGSPESPTPDQTAVTPISTAQAAASGTSAPDMSGKTTHELLATIARNTSDSTRKLTNVNTAIRNS